MPAAESGSVSCYDEAMSTSVARVAVFAFAISIGIVALALFSPPPNQGGDWIFALGMMVLIGVPAAMFWREIGRRLTKWRAGLDHK